MPQPVEARSLLPLINLASNPPAYPRNPTQKPLEPLVLYIVRVPGSRDIFLSPLKPPTKSSISPESLNASLYFLHIASPEDESVLETLEHERHLEAQKKPLDSKFALLNRVKRKPVPGIAVHNTDAENDRPVLPQRPQSSESVRKPLDIAGGQEQPFRNNNSAFPGNESGCTYREASPPILPPRPLPPLPTETQNENISPGADARRWSAQPAMPLPLPEPPSQPWENRRSVSPGRASWDGGRPLRPNSSNMGNPRGFLHQPEPPLRPRRSYDRPREAQALTPPSPPFHITLIRREPTHGHQWNVGTIKNTSNNPKVATSDGTITVEISTPGYNRFAVDNSRLSFESLGINLPAAARHSISSLPPPLPQRPGTSPSSEQRPAAAEGPQKFTRQLTLSRPTTPLPQPSEERFFDSTPPRLPHRSRDHYTFTSPWNGQCTFITGVNGRSLKCKHTIPAPSSASAPSSTSPASQTSTAAEIRFNLPAFPSSSPSGSCYSGRPGSSWGDENFAAQQPTPPEPDRLDLSLARERAGGGLRGKSAKLGKLVIEDEGLKMLDLVVAACMGVFWGYYDNV